MRTDAEVIPLGNWSRQIGRPEEVKLAPLHKIKCPLCEELRDWTEFIQSPGTAILVAFCGTCRRERRDEARRLAKNPRAEAKQIVLATLLELAKQRTANLEGRKGVTRVAQEYAAMLAKLPGKVAAVIGKTYAEKGDEYEVSDDTAVGMIRDLLLELDEEIIERHKSKRLPRIKASM